MKTFTEHGRNVALEDIKDWLQARLPLQPVTDFTAAPKALRAQLLQERVREFSEKNRWKLAWNADLTDRLGMPKDAIVRNGNILIGLIEDALLSGEAVRIANFGDFVLKSGSKHRTVTLKPCKEWLRDLNPPTKTDDIGLRGRLTRGGLVERRTGV